MEKESSHTIVARKERGRKEVGEEREKDGKREEDGRKGEKEREREKNTVPIC